MHLSLDTKKPIRGRHAFSPSTTTSTHPSALAPRPFSCSPLSSPGSLLSLLLSHTGRSVKSRARGRPRQRMHATTARATRLSSSLHTQSSPVRPRLRYGELLLVTAVLLGLLQGAEQGWAVVSEPSLTRAPFSSASLPLSFWVLSGAVRDCCLRPRHAAHLMRPMTGPERETVELRDIACHLFLPLSRSSISFCLSRLCHGLLLQAPLRQPNSLWLIVSPRRSQARKL